MQRKIYFLFGVVVISVLYGCFGRNGEQMKYVYSRPSIELDNDTSELIHFDILGAPLSDFYDHVDSIRIIPIVTTDEALIGQISQLYIVNNTLFIADYTKAKAIFAFDMQGDFLYKIHKVGQGPGEYNRLNMVHMNDSTIMINDWISGKIIQYDLRGKLLFEKRVHPNPSDFIEMNNREMLFYFGSYNEKQPYQLVFSDSDLQWKETAMPHLNDRDKGATTGISLFQKSRDGNILFQKMLCDTIFQISIDKHIKPKYHLGFHAPGEINEFMESTKDFEIKKYFKSMMKITSTLLFFELDDMYYIQYHSVGKQFNSIIKKEDYRIVRSIVADEKERFSQLPFQIAGHHQNNLLGYFDVSFFDLLSKKNLEYMYSLLDEKAINEINALKKNDNNPVIVIIYLKKS